VIRVNCGQGHVNTFDQGQVVVLWSGLLYTCGQEQSSVVKAIC